MHGVVLALTKEFTRTECVSLLKTITTNLQNQINQPGQPTHQTQLSENLKILNSLLISSPVDKFSTAWQEALEELNVAEEFGLKLKNKINKIFSENQITPNIALEKITEISDELSGTQTNLENYVK